MEDGGGEGVGRRRGSEGGGERGSEGEALLKCRIGLQQAVVEKPAECCLELFTMTTLTIWKSVWLC